MAKAKAQTLPGMEFREVPEVEKAARAYYDAKDECKTLKQKVKMLEGALIQTMKNFKRSLYNYNGVKVNMDLTEKIQVEFSRGKSNNGKKPARTRNAETDGAPQENVVHLHVHQTLASSIEPKALLSAAPADAIDAELVETEKAVERFFKKRKVGKAEKLDTRGTPLAARETQVNSEIGSTQAPAKLK